MESFTPFQTVWQKAVAVSNEARKKLISKYDIHSQLTFRLKQPAFAVLLVKLLLNTGAACRFKIYIVFWHDEHDLRMLSAEEGVFEHDQVDTDCTMQLACSLTA